MLTTAQANAVLDSLLGTVGQLPATVYVGLLLALPNPDGTGIVEVTGGSYVRQGVPNNTANWPNSISREKSHANDIVFPAATATWGTITHFGIFDAPSGGTVRIYDALDLARTINNTDQFRFLAGTSPLKIRIP